MLAGFDGTRVLVAHFGGEIYKTSSCCTNIKISKQPKDSSNDQSFLPAAQSFLLRHSWRRRSVSPFYLHAARVDQGKYPTDYYPDDSSRRRFSATWRRSTGLGQTCSFRWEAMAGSTPLLTSARRSTDHLFIIFFLNGTLWYVRW